MGELPPFDAKWWVANRKAAVLTAVRGGKITLEEALRRHQLSEEELLSRANRKSLNDAFWRKPGGRGIASESTGGSWEQSFSFWGYSCG